MSEDYYKARIGELERELAQAYADIKMLEDREQRRILNDLDQQMIREGDLQWRAPDRKIQDDEQKLWDLYRDANSLGMKPQPAMNAASWALKVWKERK